MRIRGNRALGAGGIRGPGAGAALALLAAAAVAAPPAEPAGAAPSGLSQAVLPLRYRLHFDLDPARADFAGRAVIDVRVRRPLAAIELHAHELSPGPARLGSGERARRLVVAADADTRRWRLVPADGRPIAPGPQRLELQWRGRVQAQGQALYAAAAAVGGKPEPMLATQLQAIHARRVFPSFDEPAFRARFDVSVRAPAGLEVLANMPRRRLERAGDRERHVFAPTPPMASYLLALAVGRFDVLAGAADGVPLRILSAPGKREQGRFALDATERLLPYYRAYFGEPYLLPRLDQLAVPSTRFGAMEDWGLISYAEDLLLVDPAGTSQAQRRTVFDIVAHEVAHQWFGNLVTMATWNDLWLNEAFATWMATKATGHFHPRWQIELNRRREVDRAMALDATAATRAIRAGPVRETAVDDLFDDITYVKGAAVIGMIEQWAGEDRFRAGLAAYIRAHRLANATAEDLWRQIERTAGQAVATMAPGWTDQPGFPLVQVQARCDDGRTRITLAQERFRVDADAAGVDDPIWQVPLRLARAGEEHTHLLDGARGELVLPGCSDAPVRANAGGRGFYRVAYDDRTRDRLFAQFDRLPASDRLVLLSDTAALALAGRLPLAEGVRRLAVVAEVADAARGPLFLQALETFDGIDRALARTPQQARVRGAAAALFGPELARLGWDPEPGEDEETEALRARLVRQLAWFDDAQTLAEARARAARDADGRAPLAPSMREEVLIASGRAADRGWFDHLLARLAAADSTQERRILARALASGADAGRARELLDRMLRGDMPNDIAVAMPAMMAWRSAHGRLVYDHVVEHWAAWSALAGAVGERWLLPEAADGFNDRADAARVVADQARLVGPDGDVLAARAAAQIRHRADVRDRAAGLGP